MKFIKTSLFLAFNPDNENNGKLFGGYLYTDEQGRKLFVHKHTSFKDCWQVSEPITGLTASRIQNTRAEAIKDATIRINSSLNFIQKPWKKFLSQFPVLNNQILCLYGKAGLTT